MLVEQRGMRRFDRKAEKPQMPRRIANDVTLERDVPVPMSDGVQLMANVFRSFPPRRSPVLMSVTPYGKDTLPDRRGMLLMRLSGTRFGHLDCSAWTGFEAPDPLFWVRAGYAVVQADVRGMHKSEGHAGVLSDRDAQDYYELIEWAAGQSWSTGAVGLLGVSYLAMSQWRVAALRPPSLGAICPWEGVTDLLRELGYQDGVPETGFNGEPNGWEATPRIRLAVRRSRNVCDVRTATDWPLPEVTYVALYLDAVTGTLTPELPTNEGVVQYDPRGGPRDRASFVYRFEHDTELTGGMTLSLWGSTSEGDDMDLFVLLRKFDATGKEVFFYGYNGFANDGVAKGWLRVSHRALDPERSRPGRPWHTHRQRQPVQPDEVVPVEIEVLASSTHFEAGTRLCVEVLGHDAARYPAFSHGRSVNRGTHSIHTGGRYPSALLTPFVNR